MIDTVKVFTDDFKVMDGANLTIQPSAIDYEDGAKADKKLFRNSEGKWVEGSKAYINTDRYNLTIKPDAIGEGVKTFIQFSLPKVLTGSNFHAISETDAEIALEALGKDIQERGVQLNLNACRLSRIDAFRNVYSEESFSDYTPLFNLLRAKRQLKRDYGSTFLWSNTQREICVYDKIAEVKLRGGSIREFPRNVIRFEYRLKNNRVTKKETGIETLRDINNLDAVREAYNEALEKHLFCLSVKEVEVLASSDLEAIIQSYKDTGSRYWINDFKGDFGAYAVLSATNTETFRSIIERVSGNRTVAWRIVKDFENSRNAVALHSKAVKNKTLSDLYNELKDKVLDD